MAAGKIERFVVSLQAAHHQASFQRAHNQCRQFPGIHIGANFSSSPTLFHNRLQTIKPRTTLAALLLAIEGYYHRNRWPYFVAGIHPARARRAGPENSE